MAQNAKNPNLFKKIKSLKVVKLNKDNKEVAVIKTLHVNPEVENGLTLTEAKKLAEETKIDFEKKNGYKMARYSETVEVQNVY